MKPFHARDLQAHIWMHPVIYVMTSMGSKHICWTTQLQLATITYSSMLYGRAPASRKYCMALCRPWALFCPRVQGEFGDITFLKFLCNSELPYRTLTAKTGPSGPVTTSLVGCVTPQAHPVLPGQGAAATS